MKTKQNPLEDVKRNKWLIKQKEKGLTNRQIYDIYAKRWGKTIALSRIGQLIRSHWDDYKST